MAEINDSYKTLCSLSDVKYSKVDSQELWSTDSESDFALSVAAAFNDYCGNNLEIKNCVPATNTIYIYEKNKKCNIINVTINEEKVEK